MALAIKFQELVDLGEVRDYADLARLGYVTRARITQIMNLLNLAPDIQETLLDRNNARNLPCERDIRSVTAHVDWTQQRRSWREIPGASQPRNPRPIKQGAGRSAVGGNPS
jgi:hypothetical protein